MPRNYELQPATQTAMNEAVRELEEFKQGNLSSLTPLKEIAARQGVKIPTLQRALRNQGFFAERDVTLKERPRHILHPSPELAWILGSACGKVTITPREISIERSPEDEFIEAFTQRMSNLFDINPAKTERRYEDRPNTTVVRFSNSQIASQLGRLDRYTWHKTITERFPWVEDDEYIWQFLEGMFATKGKIYDLNGFGVRISDPTPEGNTKIIEILQSAGIEYPRMRNLNGKPRGVFLIEPEDIALFASNIHSPYDQQQQILNKARDLEKRTPTRIKRNPKKQLNPVDMQKIAMSEQFMAQVLQDRTRLASYGVNDDTINKQLNDVRRLTKRVTSGSNISLEVVRNSIELARKTIYFYTPRFKYDAAQKEANYELMQYAGAYYESISTFQETGKSVSTESKTALDNVLKKLGDIQFGIPDIVTAATTKLSQTNQPNSEENMSSQDQIEKILIGKNTEKFLEHLAQIQLPHREVFSLTQEMITTLINKIGKVRFGMDDITGVIEHYLVEEYEKELSISQS